MDFRENIRNLAKGRSRILEIGPSYNPILPKRDGFKVEILDHADRATLVDKYTAFGVNPDQIEEVDHVTTDVGSLHALKRQYDMIVASHVIEHVTDLIQFLNDCDALLNDDGVLALIIPDKRFSFDAFRPLSSPGAVIDAYHTQRRLHIGSLYDHYAYFCRNQGQMAWGPRDDTNYEFPTAHTPSFAREVIAVPLEGGYVDAHEWVFLPASFQFLIAELRAAGYVQLGISENELTQGYEFFALLSRNAQIDETPKSVMFENIREQEIEGYIETQPTGERAEFQKAELHAMRKQLYSLQYEIDSLRNSTLWRLMSPVRALASLVRQARLR